MIVFFYFLGTEKKCCEPLVRTCENTGGKADDYRYPTKFYCSGQVRTSKKVTCVGECKFSFSKNNSPKITKTNLQSCSLYPSDDTRYCRTMLCCSHLNLRQHWRKTRGLLLQKGILLSGPLRSTNDRHNYLCRFAWMYVQKNEQNF